jgi:antitoxin component YwqK of YwqJK toxin-antitoxin module
MKKMLFVWLLMSFGVVFAQDIDELNPLETDTIPDLKIKMPKEKKAVKEAKPKKNVFYGKKTRKSFIKNGNITEVFHYLKLNEQPNKYIEEIYSFNPKRKKIYITNYQRLDMDDHKILHGPYKKLSDNKVIEEGFFYVGVKHGRWEKYGNDALDRDFVLIEKVKYYRGFLKESKITYFDDLKKKLKEVIPIKDGKEDGTYYLYHPNGNLAIKGTYQNGWKVGLWVEYYPNGKKKKETIYAKNWYNVSKETPQIREYDENGRLIQN